MNHLTRTSYHYTEIVTLIAFALITLYTAFLCLKEYRHVRADNDAPRIHALLPILTTWAPGMFMISAGNVFATLK